MNHMKKYSVLFFLSFIWAFAISAQDFKLNGHELELPGQILFETGSARLKSESNAVLDHIKAYLDAKTYITKIRIEVHTDAAGIQALTEQRALAVAQALVKKGVDCKRLIAVGFGNTKPIAESSTPEGKAKNRRVSIINAELRGKAIGGMSLDGGGKIAGKVCE